MPPLLLIALLLLPINVAMPERDQRQTEAKKMAPSDVVNNVRKKNWDIVEQPGTVGPDAAPALLPLLNDPDNQIRELTVQCLAMAGGPAAVQGLMKALNDRIETISAAAIRGLAKHAGASEVPALTAQMTSNNNEYVREQIALLLGRTGDAANIKPLAARKPVEKDAGARHAMSIAMARLGDRPSRDELRGRLKANEPAMRVTALRDLPYVNDRLLLAEAAPLLDDVRPGLNIGASHGPYFIRVCDVLVLVTAEMLGKVFAFEVSDRRFTPEEIAAAKKVLAGLK